MIIFLIILLTLLLGVSLYANINMLNKYEIAEEYNNKMENLLHELYVHTDNMHKDIKAIDRRGSFEADDEVGYFFKTLKEMIDELHTFLSNSELKDK